MVMEMLCHVIPNDVVDCCSEVLIRPVMLAKKLRFELPVTVQPYKRSTEASNPVVQKSVLMSTTGMALHANLSMCINK